MDKLRPGMTDEELRQWADQWAEQTIKRWREWYNRNSRQRGFKRAFWSAVLMVGVSIFALIYDWLM